MATIKLDDLMETREISAQEAQQVKGGPIYVSERTIKVHVPTE